jgi:transposase
MAGMRVQVPEALWKELEPLIPRRPRRFRYPGRRRFEERACLEGILTVLRYGIPWKALPQAEGEPSGKTCWRRLDEWKRAGVWALLLERLQERLAEATLIDWQRAMIDATFVPAKKGAPRRARARPTAGAERASSTSAAMLAGSR